MTLVIPYHSLNLDFVSERVWTCWTHPQFCKQLVTFWNMNSSVLATWAAQGIKEKSQFEFFLATFEGVFF